jgi:hypothetical protein
MAGRVTPRNVWLAERTQGAPEELRQRVLAWSGQLESTEGIASPLGQAGMAALEAAIRQGADRTVALDLLAADALVTLALLAQAESAPADLGAFAGQLRAQAAARA